MARVSPFIFGIFAAAVSHAATVNWNAATNTGLIDNGGAALGAGNLVRIGYFDSALGATPTLLNAAITTNALTQSGISILNANFHEFANTTIGTGFGGNAGGFNRASTPLYSSLPGFLPNSQIYFWAFKSSNLSDPLNTVTQTAIAYVPFASNSQWQFPATDFSPPSVSIGLANLSDPNSLFQAGSYMSGSSASLTPPFPANNHAVKLATVTPVPEPSTLTFFAMATLGAAARRRRKRK